jgi:hypothetical protein
VADSLSEARSRRLFDLVLSWLQVGSLATPTATEGETAYTGRCIQPLIAENLASIGFRGLYLSGDGVASVGTVYFMGMHYYPDAAIALFSQRLIAIEVKLLRRGNRQGAVATAIGQAQIYRVGGYEHSAVLLIDTVGDMFGQDAVQRKLVGEKYLPPVIVRSVTRREPSGLLMPVQPLRDGPP